jgi:PDZ domain
MLRRMYMIYKTIAMLIMIGLIGGGLLCPAAPGEKKQSTDNFLDVQRVGAGLQLTDGRIIVRSLVPNFPAEKSGVMTGDVVLTVDSKSFTSVAMLIDYIGLSKKGTRIALKVQRNDKTLSFDIEPVTVRLRPSLVKLNSMLLDSQKIVLAVVISDIKNTFEMKKDLYESWAAAVRNEEQTNMENFYLKQLGNNPNFSIVDRSRTQVLLDEFRLTQTGLVSDTLRLKIGEMTGATHLLDVNFSRFKNAKGYDDLHNARLIDIRSGTVLAVDQMRISHIK